MTVRLDRQTAKLCPGIYDGISEHHPGSDTGTTSLPHSLRNISSQDLILEDAVPERIPTTASSPRASSSMSTGTVIHNLIDETEIHESNNSHGSDSIRLRPSQSDEDYIQPDPPQTAGSSVTTLVAQPDIH